MQTLSLRIGSISLALLGLLFVVMQAQANPASHGVLGATIPATAPVLQNNDFECTIGYYTQTNALGKTIHIPNGWTLVTLNGSPKIHSARINFAGSCDGSAHIEKMSGIDSVLVEAQDLEKPPAPGKPFDVALYQQISATVGGAYSLSGWMLSLCGGSNVPTDCPSSNYMAKMIGLDPTGGTDPLADTVVWTENRHNFIENGKKVGWANLSTSAIAQAMTITVFARINSPFQWHGNHAFIDAFSLVRAPVVTLTVPVTATSQITVHWDGLQSQDVTAIPGGTYKLYFDVQYRPISTTNWINLVTDAFGAGTATLNARCTNTSYEFRARARAEQPPAPPDGASPNQRYLGVWSDPQRVFVEAITGEPAPPLGDFQIFLPLVQNTLQC